MYPTKHFSAIQEKLVADYLGWKVVSGSGARAGFPGDVYSDMWLGECKTHTKPGQKIRFNLKVWDKISDEAQAKFKFPVLFVDDGSQKLDMTWCMIPYTRIGSSSEYVVCDLDLDFSANILFDHSCMMQQYCQFQANKDTADIVMAVNLFKSSLGLLPISSFKNIFGD